jgi:hypothetical protein
MARRRVVYPVDTSDWMANMVLGVLIVAAVALIGLILFMDTEEDQQAAREASTEAPTTPGGAATVVPSPTSQATDGADGGAVGEVPDEPIVESEPDTGVTLPPSEEVTPLRPRGLRSEPADDGVAVVPPGESDEPEGPGNDQPTDAPDVVVPPPDETDTGDAVASEPTAPAPDEPVGPSSPLDDPNRVPALVVSDAPLDVHTVLEDLDGDDVPERVWAALVRNSVHVRVERDVNGRWTDAAAVTGAVADDLVRLEVEDLTGDGRPEIHTRQWVGVNGESVSVWSYADERLRPMTASGGCWDGETTFGVVGARVDPGQVIAICKEPPLPPYLWSTAVYRWVDGMWTFQRRVGAYG